VPQHNGEVGTVPAISNIAVGSAVNLGPSDGYIETAPKDMVTALPEQVTRIKANFEKSGRYVWHCHILSHEDHEMMRVLQVG
jgi:FtsP/CotA-like multicopper oxidase with cupredoxin domain